MGSPQSDSRLEKSNIANCNNFIVTGEHFLWRYNGAVRFGSDLQDPNIMQCNWFCWRNIAIFSVNVAAVGIGESEYKFYDGDHFLTLQLYRIFI